MTRAPRRTVLNHRMIGASLLGGALLLSVACGPKKGPDGEHDGRGGAWRDIVFWPAGPDADMPDEDRYPDEKRKKGKKNKNESMTGVEETSQAPEIAEPDPGPSVRDADTAGFPEVASGGTLPVGRKSSELPNVEFPLDVYELTDTQRDALAPHAEYLLANDTMGVILRGHTDDSGTEEYNMTLGQRRAQSVRDALIERGVPAASIETVSFGEAMPLDERGNDDARAKNRRVEFFLFER